jgi:hypothetical protein
LLRLKSVIHNPLKSVCLFRRVWFFVNSTGSGFKTPSKLVTGLSSHYLLLVLSAMLFALCAMPLSVANAASVTLGWSPNTEPDLEGYVIYRNTNSPGPPYSYSDAIPEGELVDPLHPKAKLTGLQEGKDYYISLTAYNTEGVESSFSNEICTEVVNGVIELCSASATPSPSTSSSSSGGGGSACFISTASTEVSQFSQRITRPIIRSQILAMLFLLVVLIAAIKLRFNKTNQTN